MSTLTKWPKRIAIAGVAFLAGVLAGGVLVACVDEAAPGWTFALSTCAVFLPMSIAVGFWSAESAWLSAIAMLAGVFIGVCATLLIFFPDSANLFPIAAAVWTLLAFVPVTAGALGGAFVSLKARKRRE